MTQLFNNDVANQIQAVLDGLSLQVSRPVLVDDRHGRLIAYSSQQGVVDHVRTATIMNRATPPEVTAWIKRFSIPRDDRPYIRVPANTELGMLARICFPIRSMGTMLGSLWLIEGDKKLSPAEMGWVEEATDSVRTLLHREVLLDELSQSREGELLRDVLTDRAAIRAQAVEGLHEMNVFQSSDTVAVFVARSVSAPHALLDANARLATSTELNRLRSSRSPTPLAFLVRAEHCVVFATLRDHPHRAQVKALELAGEIHQRLEQSTGEPLIVAVGGVGKLLDAALHYRRALQALDVADVVPTFQPTPAWWRLGIYRLLLKLPADELGLDDLHPALPLLLAADRGEVLVRTLERYLDNSGDVPQTAKDIFVARGSVYHRLKRIEKLAQIDLSDGEDRLDIHLSLKIARLLGLSTPSRDQSATMPSG